MSALGDSLFYICGLAKGPDIVPLLHCNKQNPKRHAYCNTYMHSKQDRKEITSVIVYLLSLPKLYIDSFVVSH